MSASPVLCKMPFIFDEVILWVVPSPWTERWRVRGIWGITLISAVRGVGHDTAAPSRAHTHACHFYLINHCRTPPNVYSRRRRRRRRRKTHSETAWRCGQLVRGVTSRGTSTPSRASFASSRLLHEIRVNSES